MPVASECYLLISSDAVGSGDGSGLADEGSTARVAPVVTERQLVREVRDVGVSSTDDEGTNVTAHRCNNNNIQ